MTMKREAIFVAITTALAGTAPAAWPQ